MKTQGLFITFEGIDGCGKSTQMALVERRLRQRGKDCLTTREPGGTPIAEKIRALLLSRDNGEMCDASELLLYLAARAQHVAEKIRPAVASGAIVLCDRFQEATFAYQGWGRGLDLSTLEQINAFATGGLQPDLTIILDIDVDTAFSRLRSMKKAPDRLEKNSKEFYEKVRAGYRAIAAAHKHVALIDASGEIEQTADAIRKRIDMIIP
jgi:dTMP kinase